MNNFVYVIPAFAGMTWATATLTLKHPQNAPDDKTALLDVFPLYEGITEEVYYCLLSRFAKIPSNSTLTKEKAISPFSKGCEG